MAGCSAAAPPKTLPELRQVAVSAYDEAVAAREVRDANLAENAATRAEAASLEATQQLAATNEPSDEDRTLVQETQGAAYLARRIAKFAEEEKRLADRTTGLKAKAYYGARGVALKVVLKGLSLAAGQADQHADLKDLPEPIAESARLAASLIHNNTGRPRNPDGSPDWAGVASDLDSFSQDPPQAIGMTVAIAGVVLRQPKLALLEIENVDRSKLKTPDDQKCYLLLRTLILAQNDMPLTAIDFLRLEMKSDGPQYEEEAIGGLFLAVVHAVAGYLYLKQGDVRAADLELVRSMRASPFNPVTVFLTGEQLTASGHYEEAAESLEKYAAKSENPEDQWFAARLAARAREVRDHNGEAKPLLTDPQLITEFGLCWLALESRKSPAAAKVQESVDTARQFGQQLLERMPSWTRE